jgi:predicted permease
MRRLFATLRRWLHPGATETELGNEIDSYLQHDIDAKIRAGMTPSEARRAAQIEFGGIEQVKEETRQSRTGAGLDSFVQDLRYAARTLTQSAGFSLAVVGSLSLGIAAVVAAFAFVNGWILRPLPGVENPDRLVQLEIQDRRCERESCWGPVPTTPRDYEALRARLQSLSGLAASTSDQVSVRIPEPRTLQAAFVTENFFDVLQIRPAIGRFFEPADDRPDSDVAVLSHGLWLREFGGDNAVLNMSIHVANQQVRIIGVAPPDFAGLNAQIGRSGTQLWLPLALVDLASNSEIFRDNAPPPGRRVLQFLGRLKDDAELPALQAEAGVFAAQLVAAHGTDPQNGRAKLSDVDSRRGPVRKSALFALIMPIPTLVLVLACLNAANLLLARASRRHREMAIRLAIGATRGRIVRQLLMESLLLAAVASAVALLLAWGALRIASVYLLLPMPLDVRVLAITLLTAVLSAVGFGLAPAFRVTRRQPARALGASQSTTDGLPERTRGRRALVVAQVTLSLALLASGTQLVSGVQSWDGSAGTPPERLLVASFDLAQLRFSPDEARAFYARALEKVSRLPNVEKVGLAHTDIVWPRWGKGQDHVVAWPVTEAPQQARVYLGGYVDGEFFEALGLQLLQGRGITAADRASARPRVVVVNRPFAEKVLGGNAVGSTIWVEARETDAPTATEVQVVGVVEAARHPSYDGGSPLPAVFLPVPMRDAAARSLYIRSRGSAESLKNPVREVIRTLDSRVPFVQFATLREMNLNDRLPHTGMAGAASVLGVIGLFLATMGLYGIVSYIMTLRSREIAVRLALGADRRRVFQMIFRQAMTLVAIGTILGGILAFAASIVIRNQTERVGGMDKLAFGGSVLALLVPMILASLIPALRAMRTDPAKFLRAE